MPLVFDALHRRGTATEAMLYAFDLLELDGEDLRAPPLSDRKKRLARLLGGRRLGIVLSDHTDDDGDKLDSWANLLPRDWLHRLSEPHLHRRVEVALRDGVADLLHNDRVHVDAAPTLLRGFHLGAAGAPNQPPPLTVPDRIGRRPHRPK
jgi:hypothetical protein